MKTTTMLPLSQQVCAWWIQALGLLGSPIIVTSESTVKSAMRGEVVDRSWKAVVQSALAGLGLDLRAAEPDVLGWLRAYDAKVSELPDFGLSLEARLPAVLDVLVPMVGVRLGALAALLDDGLWPVGTDALPKLADHVAAPFGPTVFGDAVELAMAVHRPEWKTWTQRYEGLFKAGVASKATVERWRGIRGAAPKKVVLPKVAQLNDLVALVEGEPESARTEFVLRLARASLMLQKQLPVWLGSQDSAHAAFERVHWWARQSRAALGDVGCLVALAEAQVAAFRGAGGEALWGQVGAGLQALLGVEDREGAASWLEEAAGAARETGKVGQLRFIVLQALLAPPPVFVHVLRQKAGQHRPLGFEAVGWSQVVWREWLQARLFQAVASGELLGNKAPDRTLATRHPSPELQRSAERLRSGLTEPDGAPGLEFLGVLLRSLSEMGAGAVLRHIGPLSVETHSRQRYPHGVEPVLPDDVVLAHPHLAIRRAARLAKVGGADWARWFAAWTEQVRVTDRQWDERLDAATCIVEHAHRRLDALAPVFDGAAWKAALEHFDELPDGHPLESATLEVSSGALAVARDMLHTLARRFEICEGLLRHDPREPGAVEAVALLFPLAVRLVLLDEETSCELASDEVAAEVEPEKDLAGGLAAEALAILGRDKTSGPAWAVVAIWQELTEGTAGLAIRKAKHYGSGPLLDEMRQRLQVDGLFDPD